MKTGQNPKPKKSKLLQKKFLIIYLIILALIIAGTILSIIKDNGSSSGRESNWERNRPLQPDVFKPVIYFYPQEKTKITAKLSFDGEITTSYPAYQSGWKFVAEPTGNLTMGNQNYNYLFWEGKLNKNFDNFPDGFVVPGEDSYEFLEEKLEEIGLNRKEANEFIVFWVPLMEKNEYNLVRFANKEYEDFVKLKVNPTPNSVLRVYLIFKKIDKQAQIAPQIFPKFERSGFTVVEWGGSEIKN